MTLLKHISFRRAEHILGTMMIFAIVVSLGMPSIASAISFDWSSLFGNTVNAAEEAISPEDSNAFPVSDERKPIRTMTVVATAYSSDPAQTDDTPCIPASGYDLCAHYAKYGSGNTIAANFLPLGTMVKLPDLYGDKIFYVRDRKNKRFSTSIDIWMPTKQEAIQHGVKVVKMEILGK